VADAQHSPTPRASFLSGGMMVVWLIAGAKLGLHCFFNNRYSYFRDEFDYLSCGDHLAWGYVDQPPLVPFLARVSREVLGDSLRAIRFLPALAISAVVVLTGMMAREMGGRTFALLLAAATVLIAPIYLSDGSLLVTNSFEPLLWMGCAYCAMLAVKRHPKFWLLFGAIAGLGLLQKYSIAIFGVGLVVGLLLTEHRRVLVNRWFLLGGVVAFVIFLPNLVWNIHHDWPFHELMQNIRVAGRDVELSPLDFFAQQVLLLHPLTAPVWIAGLVALLVSKRFSSYRFLAWCYVVCFVAFVILKGKNYYLAPIYPMLLAPGAVVIEGAIEKIRQLWLRPVLVSVLMIGGALLAPLVVPVLSVENLVVYLNKLPFDMPRSEHSHAGASLPQHYADQFGWEELAAKTAEAWNTLDPAERSDCAIFGQNYGQAGAIDFHGRQYGLPPALSGHQTYFLWGPRDYSGNCMVVIGDKPDRLAELFERVEFVGSSDHPYAIERNIPIHIGRGAKFGTLSDLWPKIKKWK
jgi:hypothetical protein